MTFIEILAEIEKRRHLGIMFIEIKNLSDTDKLNFYQMGYKISMSRYWAGFKKDTTKIEWNE